MVFPATFETQRGEPELAMPNVTRIKVDVAAALASELVLLRHDPEKSVARLERYATLTLDQSFADAAAILRDHIIIREVLDRVFAGAEVQQAIAEARAAA